VPLLPRLKVDVIKPVKLVLSKYQQPNNKK
jgi:hypothetical protein